MSAFISVPSVGVKQRTAKDTWSLSVLLEGEGSDKHEKWEGVRGVSDERER